MKVGVEYNPEVKLPGVGARVSKCVELEEITQLIDELAVVAWDRDMADVEVVEMPWSQQESIWSRDYAQSLRFTNIGYCQDYGCPKHPWTSGIRGTCWMSFTGNLGTAIARWDDDEKRWVRL